MADVEVDSVRVENEQSLAAPLPNKSLSVEARRRRDHAQSVKKKKRIDQAVSGARTGKYKRRAKAVISKGAALNVITTSLDVADLPTAGDGAFTGYPVEFEDDGVWTEERLLAEGFEEIKWDG